MAGNPKGNRSKTQPTAILKLAGSKHLKYVGSKKRAKEPKPKAIAPRQPMKMNAAAKAHWKYISPLLEEMFVLTRENRETLKRYCVLMSRWDELSADLDKNGCTEVNSQGNTIQRPEFRSMMQLGEECRRLECEFGLTPASRTRIEALRPTEEDKDDPKKQYFA